MSNTPPPRNISNLKNLAPSHSASTTAKATATAPPGSTTTTTTTTSTTPMSTGTKVAIGIGVVGGLALLGWGISHAQKAHAGSRR
jgi:hypothetical protein